MMTDYSNWYTYETERAILGNHDFSSNPVPWPVSQVHIYLKSVKTIRSHSSLRCDIKTYKTPQTQAVWHGQTQANHAPPFLDFHQAHATPVHSRRLRDTHKHKHAHSCIYRCKCGVPFFSTRRDIQEKQKNSLPGEALAPAFIQPQPFQCPSSFSSSPPPTLLHWVSPGF